MSDSHAFIPSFLTPPLRTHLDRDTASDNDSDSDDPLDEPLDQPLAGRPPRAAREGLPPSYRMRADAHYVETLSRPRESKPPEHADARATGAPEVRAGVAVTMPDAGGARVAGPLPDRTLAPVTAALAEAVDAIYTALAALPTAGRSLADRMGVELARAEAVRARWLAQSVAVLQSDPLPSLDQIDLGAVLAHVGAALESEHRITGATPTIERAHRPVTVFGDEALLVVAVGGMLHAMRALVESRADATRLIARVAPATDASSHALEVVQSAVPVPLATQARLFEGDWADHPAGRTGAVLLAAARRIAIVQGGSLDVKAIEDGGCRLVLSLPAAG